MGKETQFHHRIVIIPRINFSPRFILIDEVICGIVFVLARRVIAFIIGHV
jgi:hypothetical protein